MTATQAVTGSQSVRPAYDALRLPLVAGRTPLLPIRVVCDVFRAKDPLAALRALLASEPLVRHAIMLASPALMEALDAWCTGETARGSSAPLRALAYLARMSARPTPFGLCAGIGMVETGAFTTLRADADARRTHTRPDMELVMELTRTVENGASRDAVRYVANGAVLERGDRLYVTNIQLADYASNRTEQRPVSLKNTAAVRLLRELAATPTAYGDLADTLGARFEAAPEDSRRMLDSLIEAGVLVSELRVSPVGDPLAYVLDRCTAIDAAASANLRDAIDEMRKLDELPLRGRTAHAYSSVLKQCSELVDKATKAIVQVDMHAPFSGTLGENVMRDAAQLGEYLIRMGAPQSLAKFRERFATRYGGKDAMVRILELVDPNLGLGAVEELESKPVGGADRDALLMSIAFDALRRGVTEYEVTDEQMRRIAPPLDPATRLEAIEIGFQVAAETKEDIDLGNYLLVPGGLHGSVRAARTLGRFMHLFESTHRERARAVARAADAGGALTAELVYSPPTPRAYNITTRPALFDAEIRVGVGGPEPHDELALDDLWVGIDRDRLFLWSESRQCRVNPVESHVFNTRRFTPNICRLLASIARDGQRLFRPFSWGAAAILPQLPRLRVGRVVLCPRRWNLPVTELGASAETAATAIPGLREKYDLPDYVHLRDGDNLLLIDLNSPIAGEFLFDQIPPNAREMELLEALPAPHQTWVDATQGTHAAEFVATLLPRTIQPAAAERTITPITIPARPRLGPGSNWLYSKLYVGSQGLEDLLLNSLAPLIATLRDRLAVDRWFFIRYADPDYHLRLRVRVPNEHAPELRERFLATAERHLAQGVVARYTLDTYEPECERYGGLEAMDAVERFFTLDSEACVEVMRGAGRSSDARIAAAVESFYPWLLERDDLAQLALDAFEAAGRRKLGTADREALKRLMSVSWPERAASGLAAGLAGKESGRRLASLFHMHCNRMGITTSVEPRAAALLRALALSRNARSANSRHKRVKN